MKLEQSFDVAAPIDRVWAALIDVEHVASKLPGAEITGRNHDGSYDGTFTIKIGPTTASYRGRLEMESVDEATRTAAMHAQGADRRGQGGASASIVSRLSDTGQGTTRVDVDTDYHITGRLARFGRGGMIEDISERLLREFASRLQASLESNGGEATESATADEATAAEVEAESSAPAEPPPPPPPEAAAEPVDGVALVGSVVANRVRRNPWPLLALVGFCLVLLLRLIRRRR
jgi:carbon monoxide dehydrogenase subunit G